MNRFEQRVPPHVLVGGRDCPPSKHHPLTCQLDRGCKPNGRCDHDAQTTILVDDGERAVGHPLPVDRGQDDKVELQPAVVLAGNPTHGFGPSVHAVHDKIDRDADLHGEVPSGVTHVVHGDAVVAEAGIDVGELVAPAGAERATDLEEPPAIVSCHDVGHRVEQGGMTRQTGPESRQRIDLTHPSIIAPTLLLPAHGAGDPVRLTGWWRRCDVSGPATARS